MDLADIPVEVLLDNLLPFARVSDVLSLGSTNKPFAALCAEETLWRRRCQEDFNFTNQETVRQLRWKNLYRGLNHARIFVGGFVTDPHEYSDRDAVPSFFSEHRGGRFGRNVAKDMQMYPPGVPYPVEVRIPGTRTVSLVAGARCAMNRSSESMLMKSPWFNTGH
jgi:SCF-associated factor 1